MSLKLSGRAVALAAIVAAAGVSTAAPARAASIILHNIGGVTPGTAAYNEFMTAANFWGSVLTTNVTINLNVGFTQLGTNVLGQTSSAEYLVNTQDVIGQLKLNSSGDTIDTSAIAHLPTVTNGGISVYTENGNSSGPVAYGVTPTLDNNDTKNNSQMIITGANAQALGFTLPPLPGGGIPSDGTIDFSSQFAFDFDPTNGIASNEVDFLGVALHEIGHALGFISGVDTLDQPPGGFNNQTSPYATPLDLFRYSKVNNTPQITWGAGVASYFSVNGGATDLCGFSTGAVHGDGSQASHWQRLGAAGSPCGIMDPAVSFGQQDAVSAVDLDAFDAIGWNLSFDPGTTSGFIDTAAIQRLFGNLQNSAVPEPAAWGLMILGFGLTGATLRRRSQLDTIRA